MKNGRKIRRTKSLYGNRRRTRKNQIIAITVTLVAAAVLIFVGYSVGGPLFEYFKNGSSNANSSESWSPAQEYSDSAAESSVEESSTSAEDSSQESSAAQADSIAYRAGVLSVDDLASEQMLTEAVYQAKLDGFGAVVVPLKAEGGNIYFKTENATAVSSGACVSTLELAKISSIIKENGLRSIAEINTLTDHVAPKQVKELSYLFSDGVSSWYDNRPEKGGKPWMSPFSEGTRKYISEIADEVFKGGFDEVYCTGLNFPTFRNSDLEYIGETVKSPERYKSLLAIQAIFAEKSELYGVSFMTRMSAAKIIAGTEETFKPEENTSGALAVVFNREELGDSIGGTDAAAMGVYDRVTLCYTEVAKKTGEREVVPVIAADGLVDSDFAQAVQALEDMGFKRYIIQ